LILVGIAGVIAGSMAVLAFVSISPAPPVEALQAAAPAQPAPVVESVPAPTWTGARRTSWASDGSKTITFTLATTQP